MNRNSIIGLIIILVVVLGAAVFLPKGFWQKSGGVACTMEAKMCPDGSYVGRVGPNCEFAECPGAEAWLSAADPVSGINFSYPVKLAVEYINPIEWPPHMALAPKNFFCNETIGGAMGTTTESLKINDRNYCKQSLSEGAAGSIYITYYYTGEKNGKLVTTSLTLREVQCVNYDDPEKTACLNEREAFDLDSVADKIIQSSKI